MLARGKSWNIPGSRTEPRRRRAHNDVPVRPLSPESRAAVCARRPGLLHGLAHRAGPTHANAELGNLADPRTGRREMQMPAFLAAWKRNAITLDSRPDPR